MKKILSNIFALVAIFIVFASWFRYIMGWSFGLDLETVTLIVFYGFAMITMNFSISLHKEEERK